MGAYRFSLRQARDYSGTTQQSVADALHISKQTLINWEKGITPITASNLRKLSEMYGIPIEDIFLPSETRY